MERKCKADGCERELKTSGYCNKHYLQVWKYGEIRDVVKKQCIIEGCKKRHYGNGYCSAHYTQLRRHGRILERTIFNTNKIIIEGEIAKIECYDKSGRIKGYAIVDAEDAERCSTQKWHFSSGYIEASGGIRLHHFITGKEERTDHINRDWADNRKNNLRQCTQQENLYNRPKNKRKIGYKGVYKQKNRWCSKIMHNGIQYYLGLFLTEEEAAMAYNLKAQELFGEFAYLNEISI